MPDSCQAVVSTSGFPFLGKKRTLANIRTVANPSCALMFIEGCGIERSVGQLCIAQKKKKKRNFPSGFSLFFGLNSTELIKEMAIYLCCTIHFLPSHSRSKPNRLSSTSSTIWELHWADPKGEHISSKLGSVPAAAQGLSLSPWMRFPSAIPPFCQNKPRLTQVEPC